MAGRAGRAPTAPGGAPLTPLPSGGGPAAAVLIAVDGVTTSKAAVLGSISTRSSLTVGAKPDGTDKTRGYPRDVTVVVG